VVEGRAESDGRGLDGGKVRQGGHCGRCDGLRGKVGDGSGLRLLRTT
jgi:hypothetical protein